MVLGSQSLIRQESRTNPSHRHRGTTLLRQSDLFTNYCRMSKTQFEDLLTLITPKIIKTFIRDSISPVEKAIRCHIMRQISNVQVTI